MTIDIAGCVGKSPFQTWRQARRRCWILNRRKNRDDHYEPYKCRCGAYHIGRTDPEERRVNRRERREFFQEQEQR